MLTASSLKGLHVPVVTPFHPNGELDIPSFRNYVKALLQHPIHGLVLGGTTGESPSLTWEEIELLYHETKAVISEAGLQLPVTIGTGTNDTAASIRRTSRALELGADAVLVVVPYYNRPAPAGVIAHFRAIAELGIPVIAYNIPYRTGLDLPVEVIRSLLSIPNVIGLKDSSGGIRQLIELSRSCEKPILCGEDMYFFSALCAGAQGGILASSSVATAGMTQVYEAVQQGQIQQAKAAFDKLLPLIDLLYREPNPAPLKWLLAHRGMLQSPALRLPMTPISASLEQELATAWSSYSSGV